MARRPNPDKLKVRDMDVPMVLGIELDRKTLTPVRRPVKPVTAVPANVTPVTATPEPVPVIPPDPAPHTGLMSDLRSLSSGTLASLFKINDMAELDRKHAELLTYYATNYNPVWTTWIDIWKDYNATR
jgi:hypothetical protein